MIGIAVLSAALASGAPARPEEPSHASATGKGSSASTTAGPAETSSALAPPVPHVTASGTSGIEALLSQGTQAVRRGALPEAITRIEAALDLARDRAPLEARRFLLVQEEPPGFGQYLPRSSNVFSPGEEMLFYLEPVNYTFQRKGDLYEAWLKVDVNLLLPDGTVIYGKRNFFEQVFSARSKIHDLYLNLSLEVSGLDEGVYRVEYVLKDGFSGKERAVHKDVVVREPEPVLNP
jgi:hypothetical protein